MLRGREGFSEKVCDIVGALLPENCKLLLLYSIFNPMISHIDTFRSFHLDGIVREAYCAGVVGKQEGWLLRVAKGDEDGAESSGYLAGMEERGVLCLGRGGNNDVDDGREGVNGAVDGGMRSVVIDEVSESTGN